MNMQGDITEPLILDRPYSALDFGSIDDSKYLKT